MAAPDVQATYPIQVNAVHRDLGRASILSVSSQSHHFGRHKLIRLPFGSSATVMHVSALLKNLLGHHMKFFVIAV